MYGLINCEILFLKPKKNNNNQESLTRLHSNKMSLDMNNMNEYEQDMTGCKQYIWMNTNKKSEMKMITIWVNMNQMKSNK